MLSVFNEQPAPPVTPIDNSLWSALAVWRAGKAVSDAIERTGRRAVNNETEASATIGTIYGCVADALREVADFVDAHPEIAPDRIQDFNSQLVSMIKSVDTFGEANRLMDYASETLGWLLHAAAREEGSNDFTKLYNAAGSHHIHIVNTGSGVQTFDSFETVYANQEE